MMLSMMQGTGLCDETEADASSGRCEFGAPSATNFPSCDEAQVKEGYWTLYHQPAVVPGELGCACEWQRNASRGVNSEAWLWRMTARAHPAAVDKDVRGRVHHDIYLFHPPNAMRAAGVCMRANDAGLD